MDVVIHHTTVAGGFAMTRSQWLIKGRDKDGAPVEVRHDGWRSPPTARWDLGFFIDHPVGVDPLWAVEAPPEIE